MTAAVGSLVEAILLNRIERARLPIPERQVKAIPDRAYRFDFGWPVERLLVEVEGGVFLAEHGRRGAHSTGTGIQRDMQKANLATLHGWRLLRYDRAAIEDGTAVEQIAAALRGQP